MSSIKSQLLSVRSVEVYQWDEAKLKEVCEDLNIEKKDSVRKEDMINEIIKEINSQRSINNEDIESHNEDDFLIEKVRITYSVQDVSIMFHTIRKSCIVRS